MEELEFSMIDEMLEKAKKAQAEVENYTQEQVDALVKAIGKAIYDNAEMLGKVQDILLLSIQMIRKKQSM